MSNIIFTTNPSTEDIKLAFVSTPGLNPSNSLALLSMDKYVPQNRSGFYTYSYAPPGVTITNLVSLTHTVEDVTIDGDTEASVTETEHNSSLLNAKLSNGKLEFKILNSTINVESLRQDSSGAIHPLVQNGMVWRLYKVPSIEPDDSWLTKAGLLTDDVVLLGYTIPETFYQSNNLVSVTSMEDARLSQVREVVYPLSSKIIPFTQPITELNSLEINGTLYSFSGLNPGESSGIVNSINNESQRIQLTKSLSPTDRVVINYQTYTQMYEYRGFRYVDSNDSSFWNHLDLNPTFGRKIQYPESGVRTETLSSIAVYNQVLLYLIPTCFCKISLTTTGDSSDATATGVLTFDSAFNYGESHFLRHYVGAIDEQIDSFFGLTDANFFNYWNISPFGQTEYDEPGPAFTLDNLYSLVYPAMLPLAKVVLSGPSSIQAVSVSDLRKRGGGLPESFNYKQVASLGQSNNIRNLWDIGNWPGKLKYAGGTARVNIPRTALDTHTKEEIQKIVEFYMSPGIKAEINYDE